MINAYQAIYFSKARNNMNNYVASRIMVLGISKEANELYKELEGRIMKLENERR